MKKYLTNYQYIIFTLAGGKLSLNQALQNLSQYHNRKINFEDAKEIDLPNEKMPPSTPETETS